MSNNTASYHQAFDFDTGVIMKETDDKCIPRFHLRDALVNDTLIKKEWVEVITPGDRLSRPVLRVTDDHRKRWPRQYAAFKSGIDTGLQGTPITTWDAVSDAWQIQNDLRGLGFQTVEQLATAHDGQLVEVPNGMLWRKKAQIFVQGNTVLVDKDKEINELKERLAKLEANSGQVSAQSGKSDAPKKRGRRSNADKARDQAGHGAIQITVEAGCAGGIAPA